LVVGGGGAARHRYETAARDRGLADHVTFVGHVPAADLPTAYSAADLAVLPSTDPAKEGFGLVALEALACGTAVVTTTAAGVAGHLSDAGCATVVTPGDAGALAEGIEEALRADESGACGGGRDLCVDRYSWEASVDDLEAVYEAVRRGSS
jgi:glycosyltransferase involved in cell wall biosynthesis